MRTLRSIFFSRALSWYFESSTELRDSLENNHPVRKDDDSLNDITSDSIVSVLERFLYQVVKFCLKILFAVIEIKQKKRERETCVPCGLIATCTQTMRDIQPTLCSDIFVSLRQLSYVASFHPILFLSFFLGFFPCFSPRANTFLSSVHPFTRPICTCVYPSVYILFLLLLKFAR